jgi:hypothetical protein
MAKKKKSKKKDKNIASKSKDKKNAKVSKAKVKDKAKKDKKKSETKKDKKRENKSGVSSLAVNARSAISNIRSLDTIEAVNSYIAGDKRVTVMKVAASRITSLSQ